MPADASAERLSSDPEPEPLVRRGLRLLEADFREMALLALADWEQTGLVAPELFAAVASLRRPSWGMWWSLQYHHAGVGHVGRSDGRPREEVVDRRGVAGSSRGDIVVPCRAN